MSGRTNIGTKSSLEEAMGDEIRKETRYSEDEGDDHPCDIYSWSTGSEQRSVGMRKRREAVEKKQRDRHGGRMAQAENRGPTSA